MKILLTYLDKNNIIMQRRSEFQYDVSKERLKITYFNDEAQTALFKDPVRTAK